MRLLRKFIIGLGLLLTDIVLLSCCLYLTIIAEKMEAIAPNYLLWIGLVVIGFLIDLFIVKKGRKLSLLLIWNIIWMIVTAVIVALTFQCEPASIPFKIFVCGVLIVIEGHGISQALLPQRAETQLTFLDVLVILFAIFLAGCHMKGLTDVTGLQILGFISVGYTLASLIFLRTYEEHVNVVRGESVSSRLKVFGLLGAIVAISCIACGALSVMAKNATKGLLDIILLMLAGIKNGLIRIGEIFNALFSKIPWENSADGDIPFISSEETVSEETGAEAIARLPEWVLPLVGIVIVVIVAMIVIRLIWRLRKEKIQIDTREYQKVEITTSQLKSIRKAPWKQWLDKIKLRLKMYRERRTPQGLAVLVRKSGKSVGLEMQPEDSWHGYVLKLLPYGDAEKLTALSNYLKQYFYSGKATPLKREQYQVFANALKQLKKTSESNA